MGDLTVDCVFCSQTSAVLWRGEHLFLLLDIAPVVSGHLLICSNEHVASAADLTAAAGAELNSVAGWLRKLYRDEFGTVTFFEHGRTGHCLRRRPSERICHHMHVHVLPLPGDLAAVVGLGQRTGWSDWREVAGLGEDLEGYIVIETSGSDGWFYPVTHELAPHFLRTAAAGMAGNPSLDDWERASALPGCEQALAAARQRIGPALRRGPQNRPVHVDAGPPGAGT